MTVLNLRVVAGADDANQTQGGALSTANATLSVHNASPPIATGVRFQSVTVPQGAAIASATFKATVPASKSDDASFNAYAEAIDNSPDFATADIYSRTLTTAVVQKIQSDIGTVNDAVTVDVTAQVQEVVSRSGWSSGNALTVILIPVGTGSTHLLDLEAFEGSELEAGLDIDYALVTSGISPDFSSGSWSKNGNATPGADPTVLTLTPDATANNYAVAVPASSWELDSFSWKNEQFVESGVTNAMSVEIRTGTSTTNWRWLQSGTNWNMIAGGTNIGTFTYAQGVAEPYFRLRVSAGTYYFETATDAAFTTPTVRGTGSVGAIALTGLTPRFHLTTGGHAATTPWIVQELNAQPVPGAYLVTLNGDTSATGDLAVYNRLAGLGHNVTVIDDTAAAPASSDLVVAAPSVSGSTGPGAIYKDYAGPYMTLRGFETDEMLIGDVQVGVTATDITITDSTHQMAAGLSGTVTIVSSGTLVGIATLGPGAEQVATVSSGAIIAGYEAGAEGLSGFIVPARRSWLTLTSGTVANGNANFWALFDAQVTWLKSSGPPVTLQKARPVSDAAAGNWTASTGTDLFAMVDEETASDADYITAPGVV